MNRTRINALVLVAALAATTSATAAIAQPVPPVPPVPPVMEDDEIDDLAAHLGLKPDQRKAITTIQDEARKAELELRAKIEVAGIDLRRELAQTAPDEKKVGALIDKISGLEGEARKAQVVAMLRVRKLLTPEQWQRLEAARGHVAAGPARRRMNRHGHDHHEDQAQEMREREQEMREHAREMEREMRNAQREIEKAQREIERIHREAAEMRGSGGLMVAAVPYAKVLVDGKLVGTTPLSMTLAAGKHVLELRWPDGGVRKQSIEIKAGQNTKMHLQGPGKDVKVHRDVQVHVDEE